jgi:hypothetical protein
MYAPTGICKSIGFFSKNFSRPDESTCEANSDSIYWGYIKEAKKSRQRKSVDHIRPADSNGQTYWGLFKEHSSFDGLNLFINDLIKKKKSIKNKKFNFDDHKWKLYIQTMDNYRYTNI